MIQIDLSVEASALFEDVERISAYLGARQAPPENPGEHFDRIAATPADRPLLGRFAKEALSAIAEKLRGITGAISADSSGDATVFILTLSLSDSYDTCLVPSAETCFKSYMTAFVIARWLRLVLPDKESLWQAEVDKLISEITATVYHRNPPKRH